MSSTISLPTTSPSSTTIRQETYSKLTPPPSTSARTPSALSPFHTCLDEHVSSNTLSATGSHSRLMMYQSGSPPGSPLSTVPSTSPVAESGSSTNISALLHRRRSSSQRLRALRHLSKAGSSRELRGDRVPDAVRGNASANANGSVGNGGLNAEAGVPLIERPTSFSALTRRQLSKLTALALRRESDLDSFASEPVSYSASTYIASDMWLAQRGVERAERKLVEDQKAKQKARVEPEVRKSRPDDVFSTEAETQDFSSKLVRLFFSGQTANPGPAPGHSMRRFDRTGYGSMRSMRGSRGPGRGSERMYSSDRGFGVEGGGATGRAYGQSGVETAGRERNAHRHSAPEATGYDRGGGYSWERRGKFRAVKRFRWWLRRVSHRMKGEYEYM